VHLNAAVGQQTETDRIGLPETNPVLCHFSPPAVRKHITLAVQKTVGGASAPHAAATALT
jgi:hypothetical protein